MFELVCENCFRPHTSRARTTRTCEDCRTVICKNCGVVKKVHSQKVNNKFCRNRCRSEWYKRTRETRFWSKVDTSGECWLWMGSTDKDGYGSFTLANGESPVRAHRFAYELTYGPISDGFFCCHRCDVTGCVRPDHLFLGTSSDNMKDCFKKGRLPSKVGEKNNHAVLTESKVRAIRNDRRGQRVVAEEHGIAQQTVSAIVTGKSWKHVL